MVKGASKLSLAQGKPTGHSLAEQFCLAKCLVFHDMYKGVAVFIW